MRIDRTGARILPGEALCLPQIVFETLARGLLPRIGWRLTCDIVWYKIQVFFGTIFLKRYLEWWQPFLDSIISNTASTFSRWTDADHSVGSGLLRFRAAG